MWDARRASANTIQGVAMLRCVNAFLLDMDGTVYLGPNVIPGAAEFIRYLRETGRQYLFLTNNPTKDAAEYSAKLRRMGIEAEPSNVLTAGEATVQYLLTQTPYRRVFAVGTPSFEAELVRAGIEVTPDCPEAVVLAFDRTLTYAKLEGACLLLRAGLPYIATNPDRVCPEAYGYIPDCGSIAALLESATGRTPLYVGKPNPELMRMAMARLNTGPRETAMVGDRLYTDMEMAYRADAPAILVLSGETLEADLAPAVRRPDFVFPSVRELHEALAAEDRAAR